MAVLGKFPFLVSIRQNGKHICGGNLRNMHTALTAAHCCKMIQKYGGLSSVSVMAGEFQLSKAEKSEQSNALSEIILHPDYEPYVHDICVMILQMPFDKNEYVDTIRLAHVAPSNGTKCFITGWGRSKVFISIMLRGKLQKFLCTSDRKMLMSMRTN